MLVAILNGLREDLGVDGSSHQDLQELGYE